MIDGKWRRRDNEESRFWVRQLGSVILCCRKMEEGAANGKTVNSISDILGLRKM